ncbi:hypothetical protein [Actinoplanes sp. NPDC051851]|uniref:hypothetical protein n=1 Tax=Actinoplanes sp. NPDC051851 TaxID=3154753 RepID=UPI00344AB694
MAERISFFDVEYGIGLTIDGGSGRSWMDHPDGDPRHAHCRIDIPRDTLLATVEATTESEPRPSSGTIFLTWDELLAFADRLDRLAVTGPGTVTLGDGALRVRLRRDGRLRATADFTQGHRVEIRVRCRTSWERDFGVRPELPALAARIRHAVRAWRGSPGAPR